jgi:sugar phosphate isomerase/epimerase
MKLAFSTLACPDWTLEQCVAAAHDYGYDGIELRLIDGELLSPNADITRIKRALGTLPVCCVDSSVSLAQPNAETRTMQIATGQALIDIAAALGAPYLRVFGTPPAHTSRHLAIEVATQTLTALARYASSRRVTVLLETHDAFCASADVASVIGEQPGAGALWDLLHPFRIGEPTEHTLQTLGARIRHVHIKDGHRTADGSPNWPLCLLGEGDVPTADILKTLHDGGYTGWLSVEWEKKWHPHLAAPEIALPQHIAQLRAMTAGWTT